VTRKLSLLHGASSLIRYAHASVTRKRPTRIRRRRRSHRGEAGPARVIALRRWWPWA